MIDREIEQVVSRAIDELQADKELAFQFLLAFMSLERRLLTAPSFRYKKAYMLSWDSVKRALVEFNMDTTPDCLLELCADAPKKRGRDGEWPTEIVRLDPTLANAVECLRRMRNNLAHGSKGDGVSDRNNSLLQLGLMVLAYIDREGIASRLVQASG